MERAKGSGLGGLEMAFPCCFLDFRSKPSNRLDPAGCNLRL
ncbi:hypothetical protein LEMLEM_LOCUS3468 [Lemmus lemmus]